MRYIYLSLAIIATTVACKKQEEVENRQREFTKDSQLTYRLNDIPIIKNHQDIEYLMTDMNDSDGTKLNHYLYEIGIATRELIQNSEFNTTIIKLAKESNMEVAYLLDLRKEAPEFYDVINFNLSKKGLSLELISEDMTHKPLTGNPKYPSTMDTEKYEPTIFIPNLNQINEGLQPIISPNIEVDCSEDESLEDYIVSWFYNDSNELQEIIIGEETSLRTTNPLFLINHSIEKKKMLSIGKVRKLMETKNSTVNENKTISSFHNDRVRINQGYAQEQGWGNNKSEFCHIGARVIYGSPPANYVHGNDRYDKIIEIHKNDLGNNYTTWSYHAGNWTPYGSNKVYWNTWERDWNRSSIDLGGTTAWGQPVALWGRARYSEDWYAWIPETINTHATPFQWFGWEPYVNFSSWKSNYRLNDVQ